MSCWLRARCAAPRPDAAQQCRHRQLPLMRAATRWLRTRGGGDGRHEAPPMGTLARRRLSACRGAGRTLTSRASLCLSAGEAPQRQGDQQGEPGRGGPGARHRGLNQLQNQIHSVNDVRQRRSDQERGGGPLQPHMREQPPSPERPGVPSDPPVRALLVADCRRGGHEALARAREGQGRCAEYHAFTALPLGDIPSVGCFKVLGGARRVAAPSSLRRFRPTRWRPQCRAVVRVP